MEVDKVADMVVDHVADMVTNMKVDMVVDDMHTNGYFYRTQVSLGSGLWVPVSLSEKDDGENAFATRCKNKS